MVANASVMPWTGLSIGGQRKMRIRSALLLSTACAVLLVAATLCPDGHVTKAIPLYDATPTVECFLPLVVRQSPPACTLNEQEEQLAALMIDDPRQQRVSLTCHSILAQVARERALDMVERNYFGHTNPDGYGPNYLARQAGYVLPSYYGTAPDANNIESIAAGYPTANTAWNGWTSSSDHCAHLLGETPFFAEQIEYGIGYASGGDYGHYWVVITAKPGR
jgi:hypothetical protein